ncbi:hypothetical protein [Exiguobacterium acetylicum]|uniref:hypothetical protein n=1 Tax=Exiguobacterium acetylicum TaxID=41170 RepID=UPI00301668BA
MDTYSVSSSVDGAIDYGATGTFATLQSIAFLLSTLVDSCPLHREFGLDPPIDDPTSYARASLSAQIIEKIERSIPEVDVVDVLIEDQPLEGRLYATVKVVIINDSEI